MTNFGERRRGAVVLLAGGLAALALAAVLATVVAAVDHTRHNLSETGALTSASPDLAVGDRVAVVWTEDYDQDGPDSGKGYGHVYLRSGLEDGGGWGSKTPVFSGDASSYAIKSSVAVAGTEAHVAYVVLEYSYYRVYYKKCDLTLGTCGSSFQIESVAKSSNKITWVDVAVDGSGNPRIVWARYDASGQNGDIFYKAYNGSNWGGREDVAVGGGNDGAPAIAWANGYVHVVWNDEQYYSIYYKRRSDAGTWGGSTPLYSTSSHEEQPYKPDVAAWGGRVFVVWDWCSEDIFHSPFTEPYCDYFSLSYRRSNDDGDSWLPYRDVGTDQTGSTSHQVYESTDAEELALSELRPSIALNDEGWPTVVWHVGGSGEGDRYKINYAYALDGATSSVNWVISHTVLNQDTSTHASVAAAVMDGQHLHTVYMQGDEWDVYYEGFTYYPHAVINAPAMVAVTQPVTITLDGSGSYDPQGAPVITYTWALIQKPSGSAVSLSNPSAVAPTIILDELGRYKVTLQVETALASSPVTTKSILAAENVYIVYLPLVMRQ
ncbi:MAG: hypothetical protein B6I35_01265 [Anaerolineaceae bacterium 4572_32.2]|nr:MAG: hypothetical protein B6I35_01265 [Anaerolineaceae bacterium 4572_32.2]HEY72457.1 hypothetical protein [Thermoflexia bacterium]